MENEIFGNMLSRYDLITEQHKRNAIFEVNLQMILAGLYAGGLFESAAFVCAAAEVLHFQVERGTGAHPI